MSTTDECQTCHGAEWVCELHPDLAWSGVSLRDDACPKGCIGPGMQCQCLHLPADRPAAENFVPVQSLPDTGQEHQP
jgi:hypothetical protein